MTRPEMTKLCGSSETPPPSNNVDRFPKEKVVLDEIQTRFEDTLQSLKEQGCAGLCKVCLENERNITFLPCGHFISCEHCSYSLKKCPFCRKRIEGQLKTFMS